MTTRARTGMVVPGDADKALRTAAGKAIGWDASFFEYVRPRKLVVEESTPTADQLNFWTRPRQMTAVEEEIEQTAGARPASVGPARVVRLRFRDAAGDVVPVLLCKPVGTGPFPMVIATHGLGSNKAQVCAQVLPGLVQRGFAVLAADMPRHGERPGDSWSVVNPGKPLQTFAMHQQAVIEVRQLIDLAEEREDLDTSRGVILAGYSMGSWISSIAGPADDRVKAMVLMVGGALDSPAASSLPQLLATDPRRALAHFAGRPLLLLNGKNDYVVRPNWAKRLFAACAGPKEQVWYDCGHLLPEEAYEAAAQWIARIYPKLK